MKYFHCAENFVFDCMYDILEGQAHYELKLALAHMVTIKEYDLYVSELNFRIDILKYEPTELKNNPSANLTYNNIKNVSSDHKL